MRLIIVLIISVTCFISSLQAQQGEVLIDEVVAVVGNRIILESDLETQVLQYQAQGSTIGKQTLKCQILEDLMIQKLFVNQAEIDSVIVTDNQIESTLDQRVRYFASQFGSREKMEQFYGKSVSEIKIEFRDIIKEQLMSEEVQQSIIQDIKITPSEVRAFFQKIPADSIPVIPAEYMIAQIVKMPPVSAEELNAVRERLRDYRNRIIAGERFETFAALYSEDPGSASRGGELGFYSRGELYPEFEAVAFRLKKGEVSDIVKTQAGFHIIQMLEQRGERINVRHILLRPKPSVVELEEARKFLDSLSVEIESGNITFEEAVKSSDDPGKMHGGMLLNPYSGNTRFEADQIEPNIFFVIDKMDVGETSKAVPFLDEEGNNAYRLLHLKERSDPHRANLNEDYNRIKDWALENKQHSTILEWIREKTTINYINIVERYRDCETDINWVK